MSRLLSRGRGNPKIPWTTHLIQSKSTNWLSHICAAEVWTHSGYTCNGLRHQKVTYSRSRMVEYLKSYSISYSFQSLQIARKCTKSVNNRAVLLHKSQLFDLENTSIKYASPYTCIVKTFRSNTLHLISWRIWSKCLRFKKYRRTSMARTLMARLPRLFRTHSWVRWKKAHSCRFGIIYGVFLIHIENGILCVLIRIASMRRF